MRCPTKLLLTLTVALTTALGATAQLSRIPGSGCPGSTAYPRPTGVPSIGTRFSVGCPPSIDRMQVIVGFPVALPFVIGQPIMCVNNCTLDVNPVFVTSSGSWNVAIPNNTALIGAPLVAQCLQSSLNRTCLLLTGALSIKILP